MKTNNNEVQEQATQEWNKFISLLRKNRESGSERKVLEQTLNKWFDSSANKFCEGGRYIVYAVFAFCWTAVLGIGIERFERNDSLCIGIIVGFLYLAVDLFRNLYNAVVCRRLEDKLNDKDNLKWVHGSMNELSDTVNICMWIQCAFFVVLVFVMGYFLANNL